LQEFRCEVGGKIALEAARRLFETGVSTLICGGIETYFKDWLIRKAVTVLDNQREPVWEVIRNTRAHFTHPGAEEIFTVHSDRMDAYAEGWGGSADFSARRNIGRVDKRKSRWTFVRHLLAGYHTQDDP